MEPVTALVSIVGLLRIFKQERGERKKADHQTFMEWLDYHRHEDLKNLIANTSALRVEVDKILAGEHAAMLEKLDQIQTIVATILSRVDEFRSLSLALAPGAQLSEQALSVLRQFVKSADETLFYASYGPDQYVLQTDCGEPFGITDTRFLTDDLEQLARLGLLTLEDKSDGRYSYRLARSALRYLEATDGKAPD